ncbi:amidohydrolase family protein [Brevibacterium casei]|uniref:amidohydrolase family protein n=1 Tax=Brevibacterium casei TaxID=33889 RepID=UPI0036FABB52
MTVLRRVFDAHFHIIDPAHPLVENDGFLPDPFTVADYRARVAHLGATPGRESPTTEESAFTIAGGAVVSGSFQAFDQGYLVEALRALGPSFVGVTQLPADTPDARILELAEAGVRAVRFNVARGGSAQLDDLDRFARRVHDLAGWHTELYIDARTIDSELAGRIVALPAVSIDHLGMHSDGLPTLLRLVEGGVKVKATGFGRVDLDPAEAVRSIVDTDPSALMVGTDLPSTRARRPFADDDLRLIESVLTPAEADAVFWGNAAAFYLGDVGTRE